MCLAACQCPDAQADVGDWEALQRAGPRADKAVGGVRGELQRLLAQLQRRRLLRVALALRRRKRLPCQRARRQQRSEQLWEDALADVLIDEHAAGARAAEHVILSQPAGRAGGVNKAGLVLRVHHGGRAQVSGDEDARVRRGEV